MQSYHKYYNIVQNMFYTVYIYISGWWFRTFFIFPNNWDDDPIWRTPSFFRGVGQHRSTTNQIHLAPSEDQPTSDDRDPSSMPGVRGLCTSNGFRRSFRSRRLVWGGLMAKSWSTGWLMILNHWSITTHIITEYIYIYNDIWIVTGWSIFKMCF